MRNMSGIIRVTPEELRATAKQYGVESQEVLNQVDRLNRMISDLKNECGKVLLVKHLLINTSSLSLLFIKMSDLLTDVSNQLDQTANTLESTDQDIASQIRG
ncbi:protein YukE [Bacillus safensis]|uniref:Protein YukE n=1 Tax=Bacillus safensis TaxID=561879 RepID=A0A5S9MGE1_BACIA|nr:protein YukE [Bacillus safensis]